MSNRRPQNKRNRKCLSWAKVVLPGGKSPCFPSRRRLLAVTHSDPPSPNIRKFAQVMGDKSMKTNAQPLFEKSASLLAIIFEQYFKNYLLCIYHIKSLFPFGLFPQIKASVHFCDHSNLLVLSWQNMEEVRGKYIYMPCVTIPGFHLFWKYCWLLTIVY